MLDFPVLRIINRKPQLEKTDFLLESAGLEQKNPERRPQERKYMVDFDERTWNWSGGPGCCWSTARKCGWQSGATRLVTINIKKQIKTPPKQHHVSHMILRLDAKSSITSHSGTIHLPVSSMGSFYILSVTANMVYRCRSGSGREFLGRVNRCGIGMPSPRMGSWHGGGLREKQWSCCLLECLCSLLVSAWSAST